MPIVQPEFPGGAKGLPRIPGAWPRDIGRAASPLADVQRQYLEYSKGRSLAEESTSAISNADAFRGIREKLEASTQHAGEQAAKSIAEGGREGASFFDNVADSTASGGKGRRKPFNKLCRALRPLPSEHRGRGEHGCTGRTSGSQLRYRTVHAAFCQSTWRRRRVAMNFAGIKLAFRTARAQNKPNIPSKFGKVTATP